VGNLVVRRIILRHRIYTSESAEILYLQRASYLQINFHVCIPSLLSEMAYNVLRIKEVAEGNLGEVKRSLLSAVK